MSEETRQRVAVIAIAVGAVYGAWAWFTVPKIDAWRRDSVRLTEARQQLESVMKHGESAPASRDGADATRLLALRFERETLNGLQERVHEIARTAGASVLRIEGARGSNQFDLGVLAVMSESITAELEGDFGSLTEALSLIAEAPMATVESASLRGSRDGEALRMTLTLIAARGEVRVGAIAEGTVE